MQKVMEKYIKLIYCFLVLLILSFMATVYLAIWEVIELKTTVKIFVTIFTSLIPFYIYFKVNNED